MSDFDKEAERQKLREKFDHDREKRKETERMSQLLLQGATMTNRHCDACGDPLFRYQGQVFCPTCEGRAQEAEGQTGDTAQPESGAEATETPATAEAERGDTAAVSALDATAAGHPEPAVDAPTEDGDGQTPAGAETETDANVAAGVSTATESTRVSAREPNENDGDELAAARASLVRTLQHHAQAAEAADGPRRAREHLSAAREAAEALAALDERR